MPKQVQDELRELKDHFLESVSDYLERCIVLEDVKRMRRFIENVSNHLRDEVSKASKEEDEKKRLWHIILKDVKLTADFRFPVSLDMALDHLSIAPERVEEAY